MASRELMIVSRDRQLSRVARVMESMRAYWRGPWGSGDRELAKFLSAGPPASTGLHINEENALSYSAVWSAVSIIASAVANLPLVLYKKLPDGGKERFESHPLYRLLHDRPNPEQSSFVFREALQAHVLTWGNAYAEIERDNANRPRALWPLTPDRVKVFRTPSGELKYEVSNWSEPSTILNSADVLHIPGLSFDGITGYGVIAKMRESIGLGLAAERFGGSFFGNGATFGGVFEHPTRLTEQARKNFVDSVNRQHQGVDRAHKFLVVEEGMKYSRTGTDPDHAQFLETRTFQLDEVARWLNVPPHKLKNLLRSTNNNIEHQNLEYYIDCLSPWCNRWEQELAWKLIAPAERNLQDIEHVVEGLLRGDVAARGEFHSKQFNTASITPNEIRKSENRNPLPGGDRAFVALNMIALDKYDEWIDAQIEATRAKAAPPEPKPDPAKEEQIAQLTRQVEILTAECARSEEAKDLAVIEQVAAEGRLDAERAAHEATRIAKDAEIARLVEHSDALSMDLAAAQRDLSVRDATIAKHEAVIVDLDARCVAQTIVAETAVEDLARARTAHAKELDVLHGASDTLARQLDAMTRERDSLEAEAVTHDAVTEELRTQIANLTADLQASQAEVLTARVALAESETRERDTDTSRKLFEDLAAARSTELDHAQRRFREVEVASRAVVIDCLAWMVDYEAERIRAKQGSPEKLRKWIADFYSPEWAERCRKILRPSVKAWAICVRHPEPVEHVLDLLVAQHIEQSVRQLRTLANEQDVETLAPALEKLLRRWETSRAETLADRILKEAA